MVRSVGGSIGQRENHSTRMKTERFSGQAKQELQPGGFIGGENPGCALPQPTSDSRIIYGIAWIVSGLAFAFSLWAICQGWKTSIFGDFNFRQCQTALSAQTIRDGGPIFAYQTPVLGPPWSIPFEFPLYQGLVALFSGLTGMPLELAGRLISALFFYATLVPLYYGLGFLKIAKPCRVSILALVAASPFYIFWSRAFMIESTALFLSMVYIVMVLRESFDPDQKLSPWFFFGIAAVGSLAGMVKITTYASFWLAGSSLAFLNLREKITGKEVISRRIWRLGSTVVLPVIATWAWTRYADAVKSRNPMAGFLLSKALRSWNFGTLQQRLRVENYSRFGPVLDSIVGTKAVIVLAVFALFFIALQRKKIFLSCVLLWMSGIAIFFNLHVIHSYYAYANGIFLVLAIGIAISGLLEKGGNSSQAGLFLLCFCLGSFMIGYHRNFYVDQETNALGRAKIADLIDSTTKPEDVILIYGLDWSPVLPYQAHRRAIMDRYGVSVSAQLQSSFRLLSPQHVGVIVVCDAVRNQNGAIEGVLESMHFQHRIFGTADNCDLYLPAHS